MASYDDIVAFLADPATHGGAAVRRVETHCANLFLAGDVAYKIKKPVDLGYLDFSTLDKRHWTIGRELMMNRRTAPGVYESVLAVTEDAAGLHMGGAGAPVEWVLKMKRFDDDRLLSKVANRGELSLDLVACLAADVAAFHKDAERVTTGSGAADVAATAASNDGHIRAAVGPVFEADAVNALRDATSAAIEALRDRLDARRRDGFVRIVHGDLHLRNIFEQDGKPVLFDCIEFSDRLATIDILYDLAFLLMDIDHRGLGDHGARAFNDYFAYTPQDDWRRNVADLEVLPLFLSIRAAVRAHVEAQTSEADSLSADDQADRRTEARGYLDRALSYLQPSALQVLAIGGLSGTGKSTLARALAARLADAPGALVLRSDETRKRLHGVPPTVKLPQSAYGPGSSAPVYAEMFAAAKDALAAGRSVILDAVFMKPEERAAAEAVAAEAGVPFCGAWLEGGADLLRTRVAARRGDASDAGVDVLNQQLAQPIGDVGWRRFDAGADRLADAVYDAARL